MDGFKVSYNDILSCATNMKTSVTNMKNIIASAKKISSSCMNSWTGDAESYYENKLNKLLANFDNMYPELEASVTFLNNTAEKYKSYEAEIEAAIIGKG